MYEKCSADEGNEASVCGCLSSCRAVRPSGGVLKGCLPRLDLVSLSGGVCVCLRARSPRLTRPSQRLWRSVVNQAGGGVLRSVLRHIQGCYGHTLTTIAVPSIHTPPHPSDLTSSTLIINITGRCFASISASVLHDMQTKANTRRVWFDSIVLAVKQRFEDGPYFEIKTNMIKWL